MSAPFGGAPLQIITADQRLRETRGIKGVLTGISGIGKTSQLWTLDAAANAFPEPRGGRARGAGLARRRGPHPRLGASPAISPAGSAAPNPAMRDDQPYGQERLRAGLRRLRRLPRCSTSTRRSSSTVDLRRLAHLPAVVQGPAAGDLRPQRQAGSARRLRAARPGDDRLADPSAAHAAQEHLAGRPARPAARRLRQAVLRHADRGLEDRPRAARHRRRGRSPWPRSGPKEGAPFRAFVCTTINDFGFPAKDRSGRLAMLEPAHLGRLMAKIRGPRPDQPAARLDFDLPAAAGANPTRRLERNPWRTTWTSTAPTARTPPST